MTSQSNFLARAGTILSALILFVFIVSRRPADSPPPAVTPTPRIQLLRDNGGEVFEVGPWSTSAPATLSGTDLSDAAWAALFAVTANDNARPMLGTYSIDQGSLFFHPQWPLIPGVVYTATYQPEKLPGNSGSDTGGRIVATFTIPAIPLSPPAKVAAVYPSADRLPENLLRIYLQFTGPMRRGDVYDYIRLIGPDGKSVESPFVTFGEELWNADGTRLTLLLDPGRQKHDLLPRQQAGPVLEAGKRYTLAIGGDWPDAHGRPLGHDFRKQFTAIAAEPRPILPAEWKLTSPHAGSRDPLVVMFDRPLDQALLQRMDSVVDAAGHALAGEVKVTDNETTWRFVPQQPWAAGEFALVVEPNLEDVSGNRVGRAFEVDEDRTETGPAATVRREFTIGKQ